MSVEDLQAPLLLPFDQRASAVTARPRPRTGIAAPGGTAARWSLAIAALFTVTAFVGAGLLFMVQPMAAKVVLPLFGGSPAVWNTSNLFFQVSLLAGYVATHLLIRRLGARRQSLLHLGLVAFPLLALPIGLPEGAAPSGQVPPALWLLYVLAACVGAPFLVLSTTGPLLQRWFGATAHPRARDPYFLFAAGNAGSLLALISYPVLVEPRLPLDLQFSYWSYGYAVFALLIVACVAALRVQHMSAPEQHAVIPATSPMPVAIKRKLRWLAVAALPSSFMLGTTTYLTTDLTPFPLLWVIPLALYLASFIVAFALRREAAGALARRLSMLLPLLLLAVAVPVGNFSLPVQVQAGLHLLLFTVVATMAHARLAEDRPEVEHLTTFYVLLAAGGALGGAVNALVAPLVFDHFYEYPLTLAAAALLIAPRARKRSWFERRYHWLGTLTVACVLLPMPLLIKGAAAVLPDSAWWAVALLLASAAFALVSAGRRHVLAGSVALVMLVPVLVTDALTTTRTFFGVQTVARTDDGRHALRHGTTLHGWQDPRPSQRREPSSYYHRQGPAGQIMSTLASTPTAHVGVVGLGTGALAAYGRPDDDYTFFEIDSETIRLAEDERYFTYLNDSQARVRVVLGDGRLSLQTEPDGSYDVLVLDAFSSDAIPVHLVTREAVSTYLSKLKPGGLLLFHISNRHVDLAPVLGDIAQAEGARGLHQHHRPADNSDGQVESQWVVLSQDWGALEGAASSGAWGPVPTGPDEPVWSDDFSNILGALR